MSYSLTKPQTLTAADRTQIRAVVTYHVDAYTGSMLCGMTAEAMRAQKHNVHQTAVYVNDVGNVREVETNCAGCCGKSAPTAWGVVKGVRS